MISIFAAEIFVRAQFRRQHVRADVFEQAPLRNDVAHVRDVVKRDVSGVRIAAAMHGKAEFFAPLIETRPLMALPPESEIFPRWEIKENWRAVKRTGHNHRCDSFGAEMDGVNARCAKSARASETNNKRRGSFRYLLIASLQHQSNA